MAQNLSLDDTNTRKIRKLITRAKDGSFEVCEMHERRMRATAFEVLTIADPETHEVTVHALAHLSCGHSKRPCTDDRKITLADGNGINPAIVAGLKLVTADDKEEAA